MNEIRTVLSRHPTPSRAPEVVSARKPADRSRCARRGDVAFVVDDEDEGLRAIRLGLIFRGAQDFVNFASETSVLNGFQERETSFDKSCSSGLR